MSTDNTPVWQDIWEMIRDRWQDDPWLCMCIEAAADNFSMSMVEVDPDYATEIADVCEEAMWWINTHTSVLRRIMLARNLARATGAPVDHLVAIAERGGK
jgi:hypothetical protein